MSSFALRSKRRCWPPELEADASRCRSAAFDEAEFDSLLPPARTNAEAATLRTSGNRVRLPKVAALYDLTLPVAVGEIESEMEGFGLG